MELFQKLFGKLLLFVYHCFDRIVINGYLSGLSRPEQVVHFLRQVIGVPIRSSEMLAQRTSDYHNWVEAFAGNHKIPSEWGEKGVRKEDYVLPWLRRMRKKGAFGVYFIFKSMEQGPTFRISVPKHPTKDPNHRILAPQRSRFTHYYFYICDQVLGPIVMRVASFLPFQATYYLNGHSFIEQELERRKVAFRKNDNAFLAVDDVAALQAAADRLSPQIIQKQLDYWTLILGPKFSRTERKQINLSRFYAIGQIEYCRNFIFKRSFPIHKIFERGCEMPRIRDLADQQLYRVDPDAVYPNLAGIFRGGVDVDLIPEQWDQLVRVAASLKNRVCPAHVVVQRLANSSPSDRLAKALTMLGRVVKTI